VDTKYEFGKTKEGVIVLIDEIHTPDSSRYFLYRRISGKQDKEKSKSNCLRVCTPLVNQNGFQGLEGSKFLI
jgi:phosphoribosylaminoimidazole-succinocarboxamide synthase